MFLRYTSLSIAALLVCTLFAAPISTYAHVGIPNTPTTSCGSIDSVDFTTHVTNQMDTRIAGVSTSSAMQLFSTKGDSQTVNGATSTDWVRNVDAWSNVGTDIDWTGVSAWNQPYDGYSSRYQKAGTLISPRHIVLANHWYMPVNSTLLFVSNSNEMVYRTLSAVQPIAGTDITIGVLDSDVPDSVTYYPIIASSTLQALIKKYEPTSGYDIPMVAFDQEKKAIVRSLNAVSTFITHSTYVTGSRSFLSESLVGGDSGSPAFIVVDNRPILLFTHYTASGGPFLGNYISQINSAMTTLGGGYQATVYDPACFTQYVPNNIPVFTNGTTATTTTAVQNPSTVLYRYTATDADPAHTVSFYLRSLVSVSSSTLALNPNTYFSIDSSTGELRQIANIDNSVTGNSLTLVVSAIDNGTPQASSTVSTPISISYPSISQTARSGNTVQIQYSNTLDETHIPSATDFTLRINGTTASISSVQISGSTVSLQSSTAIRGGDALTLVYRYGSRKIRDTTGAYASEIQTPISISNTHIGDIDTSFNPGSGFNGLAMVAGISNGKLIAGGVFTSYNGQSISRVARINTDGSLDTTFNPGTGPNSAVTALSVVEGGKILIGGAFTSYNGSSTNRIAKLNTDGSLDTTFNPGTGLNGPAYAFCTAPDGAYYVGGSFTTYNGTTTKGIVKLHTDGTIDTSFAPVSGILGSSATIRDCAVQSNGAVILSGLFTTYDGNTSVDIVRVLADGSYDPSFVPAASLQDYMGGIYTVAVLSDNRIAVGGISSTYVKPAAAVILTATGAIDTELSNIEVDTVLDIIPLSDGSFITFGGYHILSSPYTSYGGMVQFNANGTVNDSFSAYPGFTVAVGYPYKGVIDAENRMYVVGNFDAYNGVARRRVARLFASTQVEVVVTPTTTTSSGGGGGGGGGSSAPAPAVVFHNKTTTPSSARMLYASQISVKEVQQFLNKNGFPIAPKGIGSLGKETQTFGPKTRVALLKYQKAKGIPQTGVLDVLTRQTITTDSLKNIPVCVDQKYAVFPKTAIKFGAKNVADDVRALEQFLNAYENLSLPVDGVYSATDRNAVILWQQKHAQSVLKPAGLKKGTGNVSANSLRVMNRMVLEKGC